MNSTLLAHFNPAAVHHNSSSSSTHHTAFNSSHSVTPNHTSVQQPYELRQTLSRSMICRAAEDQPPKREKPDLGRRNKRHVKIPTMEDFATNTGSKSADPDSQGYQERALLMAYLETLDPSMRQQFAQYMDMRMEQMEQRQDVQSAADYMRVVIDKAGDQAGVQADNFNADHYVDSKRGQEVMWQSLREQFSPEEQSLLDQCLGPVWSDFDAGGFSAETIQRINNLDEKQGAMLSDILSKMTSMMQSMDTLASDVDSSNKPGSSSSGGGSSGRGNSGASSSSSWGRSFSRKKSDRVRSKATQAAEKYWDKFMDGDMTDKVQKMMYYANQASQGTLTFGRPATANFKTLKQVYTEMVELEGVQLTEPGRLTAEEITSSYARINYTLNQLVNQLEDSGAAADTATRSALLYMDAVFNSSTAASSSSSSSGEEEQQGSVDLGKLHRLGRFLKAAENLDAFQTWLSVFAEKHPGLTSLDMLTFANIGGDDWFVKPQQQQEALAAAQQAAAAWQAAAAGVGSSSSSSTITGAISAALLPYIDEERIEALAALDADTLWFLTELEVNDYNEDVLMKWSLHPEISQKLLSGRWFDELEMSEPIRNLYQQAKAPGFMNVLDFNLKRV